MLADVRGISARYSSRSLTYTSGKVPGGGSKGGGEDEPQLALSQAVWVEEDGGEAH